MSQQLIHSIYLLLVEGHLEARQIGGKQEAPHRTEKGFDWVLSVTECVIDEGAVNQQNFLRLP